MTGDQAVDGLRRFSNLQWFFAHADYAVHLICACPHDISELAFHDLVDRSLSSAPQLELQQCLAAGGFRASAPRDIAEIGRYQRLERQTMTPAEIREILRRPLSDSGRPAFRAHCFASPLPDENGTRSWLVFESSHALLEGGDITAMLRGQAAAHDTRPVVEMRLTRAERLAFWLAIPAGFLAHLAGSWRERRQAADFNFRRVALSRPQVAKAARAMGVSQRALLFGMILHSMVRENDRHRILTGYTVLPKTRARLYDDEYTNTRTDEFRFSGGESLPAYIAELDKVLAKRPGNQLWMQAFLMKLLGLHRWLYHRARWLYPGNFFHIGRYGMILSLLPPVRPSRRFDALSGATAFAGSTAGVQPACVLAPGEAWVTLNFWADAPVLARTGQLLEAAQSLGIEAQDWG